ncbi:MAG: biotin transporter BioY [Oscillospiraceae bacterium]
MKKIDTRKLLLAALFAALTAVGAFLRIPLGLSAITLQFLFTALAGVLLGAKYGALSQAVYVALGLVGLPVFTQGGGLSYLLIPSCGFLFGLIPAAAVIGLLTKNHRKPLEIAGACCVGLAVLYLVGLPYMAVVLNVYMGKNLSFLAILTSGMLLYLPGDGLKIVVTALLSKPLLKVLS